jgi:signal transduction histidine kinase
MDFGMFHDGNFEVNPVRFRLGGFSERIDLEIAPLCSSKGLTWKMDIEDVFVWTDQDLLLRLFRNLLTNAIRYTASGEVCCSAKASVDTVEFLISDTGIGIPVEQQEDVFRKFVQLQNSGIGAAGEGLGLSIVAKIDQALNLGLQMSSVIGKGTEFRFRVSREPSK